ncbi:hypothetical protein N7G274_000939 [Stereocaulon virgatum]|uniref:Uncharacterized protein n=1 Tax=Stereocaulon virgatum TaxID=373712 RepID=A0ABR4AQ73_9LECA
MLKMSTTRLALFRVATTSTVFRQPTHPWKNHRWPTAKAKTLVQQVSFMSGSNISISAFRHEPKIDSRRQAFSVYFDEDGDAYRFEVSAPDDRSFDSVWDTVGRWLKYQADHEWSKENIEFAVKACGRANSMRFLRLIKETDMEIIPVAEAEVEDMDDIEADCEERENRRGRVFDVGGDLMKLKVELECGAGNQGRYHKFQGPFDLEKDLGGGVKIRLCNRVFADKVVLEH